MKKKPIPESTRTAILNATWKLMEKKRRLDVGQMEIAEAAGVSRQTVYLAFGNRAGLLTAMVRHRDMQTDHVARLGEISRAVSLHPRDLRRYLEIWFDYVVLIYPVGIVLDAAALTDRDAASAWDDRMKGALLAGLKRIFVQLAKGRYLAPGWEAEQAAELVWSLIHPTALRQLVDGCGWSLKEFSRSRMEIIKSTLLTRAAAVKFGGS